MPTKELIVVIGPTASGKTEQALEIAQQTQAIILTADSRMVYQRLDIGTGKPTWEHRQLLQSPWLVPTFTPSYGPIYRICGIEHFLLDLVPPGTQFSLTDWLVYARAIINEYQEHDQQVVIVGGTGLYIKSLIEGYLPPPTDAVLRAEIEELATEEIIEELRKTDQITAVREQKNRRRLVRALEVVRLTDHPMSDQRKGKILPAQIVRKDIKITELRARINQRIIERLDAGMVREVEDLLASGVSEEWLLTIGLEYRIITKWLQTKLGTRLTLQQELEKAIYAYARRQETYIRAKLS